MTRNVEIATEMMEMAERRDDGKRRNATPKLAKGYWGSKSKHFKMAKQQVMKSGNYALLAASAEEA